MLNYYTQVTFYMYLSVETAETAKYISCET